MEKKLIYKDTEYHTYSCTGKKTEIKRILQLRNIQNSANYFSLNNEIAIANSSGVIQPTAIGRLITP